MRLKHLSDIALALMLARWKQTLVAAIGVTFSIALFVTLLGFMEGLNKLLDGIVLNRTPHIRLYNDIQPSKLQPIDISKEFKNYHNFISSVKPGKKRREIYNAQPIINKLERDDRILGLAPKITDQVFYNLGNIDLNGVISGLEVEQEAKLFAFSDYIIEGKYQDLQTISNSIIIGQGVAEVINAKLGDVVTVTAAGGEQFPLKVIGFFESGITEIDKVQSFASLSTTRKLLGVSNNYISDIQIKLKDLNIAPTLAIEYEDLFSLDAEDIQTANAQFETGSGVRSIISYAVKLLVLQVAT